MAAENSGVNMGPKVSETDMARGNAVVAGIIASEVRLYRFAYGSATAATVSDHRISAVSEAPLIPTAGDFPNLHTH